MGPTRTTATKLIAITLPIVTVDFAARFRTIAISGGSKPKINPTPKLVENTAARTHWVDRSFACINDHPWTQETKRGGAAARGLVLVAQSACVPVNAMLRIEYSNHKWIGEKTN